MDIDNVAGLELVADDFGEELHKRLDEGIRRLILPQRPKDPDDCISDAAAILGIIVARSDGRLCQDYADPLAFKTLIQKEPRILDLIFDGFKNGFKPLRLLKLLRPEPVSKVYEHPKHKSELAHVRAWGQKYVGYGADALWAHVQEWFHKGVESASKQSYYAKYSAIVQSSGMGKSRSVDEMSRFHLVIPVVLREAQSTGYPPVDSPAYDYLSSSSTQRDAFLRSCAFLHALFHQTVLVLKSMKKERLAEHFRDYMNEGMQHGAHGLRREEFFGTVKTLAEGFYSSVYSGKIPDERPSVQKVDQPLLSSSFPLNAAAEELCKFLENEAIDKSTPHIGTSQQGRARQRPQSPEHPLVTLAFDEVHSMTKLQNSQDGHPWSRFDEIRHAIQGLMGKPVFTLFLSTSGTLFSITPSPERDIPVRMVREKDVILPFSDLGFDQLAVRVDSSETVTLSRVASEEHLTSYGRPLWVPYYRSPDKKRTILFAATKLLGGRPYEGQALTPNEKLACLAHRIPIEFLSRAYASQISDVEKEQVHSHMRVILKIDDNLESMVTTSPSEPALSEAAYFLMTVQPNFRPPQALQEILDGFAVNKGESGELIVALLFIMARDKAVGVADGHGRPPNNQRWSGVTELFTSLFRTPPSAVTKHVNILTSPGWRCTGSGTKRRRANLADTFKDSKVYFTHFIRVHQWEVIHVKYLVRLMLRGAAILCGSGQRGVDGIIPFLLKGDEIREDNIGVIMFQAKNNDKYTDNPDVDLFHHMDPCSLEVISRSADVPVIRIVFALAAKTPALVPIRHKSRSTCTAGKNYTAYDFWVAGLSLDLLVPVINDASAWNSILQTSHGSDWDAIYSNKLGLGAKLRKSMNPGAAAGIEFWENWCEYVSP